MQLSDLPLDVIKSLTHNDLVCVEFVLKVGAGKTVSYRGRRWQRLKEFSLHRFAFLLVKHEVFDLRLPHRLMHLQCL